MTVIKQDQDRGRTSVFLNCPYAEGYENSDKYFYKGLLRDNNLILKSDGGASSVSEGRFSLRDDHQKRLFTLTIRNLSLTDAGEYTCGAGRWGDYKLIKLNVIRAPQKTRPVQISTSTLHSYTHISTDHSSTAPQKTRPVQISTSTLHSYTHTSTDHSSTATQKTRPVQISTSTLHSYTHTSTDHSSTVTPQTERETTRLMTGSTAVQLNQPKVKTAPGLSSVAGGLGSVLLVLVLCSGMFLILKKRKRKSGTALFLQNVQHNTEAEFMYEEIPNSDVIATASPSNQTPASHLNSRPQDSAVYATVTKQQPDSNPHQAQSTNQVTDTDCDYYANMKPPEPTTDNRIELIYSTVTRPQNIETNDSLIYSVIKHK
ncbi:CMRF35-like molecule 9 [Cyprinus carpio]|uniref:CMRF35-like molecule 9 n=1 Tax=Cyprinus carpio TaxID=7962 RepID=A0A9Q9ZSC3_CYPCA|nr:CMRF35-like molecule 9 [Cyprinus carpio]